MFGWRVQVPEANPAPWQFPDAGEWCRNAATGLLPRNRAGIEVCAPVHDAVLICAPLDRLDDDVSRCRSHGRGIPIVLDGFELGTDAKIVRYPDRYWTSAAP